MTRQKTIMKYTLKYTLSVQIIYTMGLDTVFRSVFIPTHHSEFMQFFIVIKSP